MKRRAPKHVIDKLHAARKNASLETAIFGFPTDTVLLEGPADRERRMTVDAFIKERIRIHHDSWVLPLLDELLAWAEGDADGRG